MSNEEINTEQPNQITEVYVTFAGIVDEQVARKIFQEGSKAMGARIKRIHLLIQTPGGVIGAGIAIYNFLRKLPIEIITYNAGSIESVGVIMYLAGDKRKASSTATFLIHKGIVQLGGGVYGSAFLQSRVNSLLISDANTESILKGNVNIPPESWEIYAQGDLVINAHDALRYGLIDDIEDFAPPLNSVLVNIDLSKT